MHHTLHQPLNSWDVAKLLGLLLMFVDHSGHFYFTHTLWLRAIGRGAAPVFFFLVGYAASYRFKWELFALAMLMSVSDFLLTGHLRMQNILVTILLIRLLFYWLESKGRTIERPWEWYVGSLAMIASIFVTQYASLGLLFAISGYMKRRGDKYPHVLQRRFMILSFVAYGIVMAAWSDFSFINTLIMSATLFAVGHSLWTMQIKDIACEKCPVVLMRGLKFTSYCSGYIYALHLIALEWLTGIPF